MFTRDVANVNTATMYFRTDFSWVRVIIDSLRNDDGFGIDNSTFENAPEPAVTTLLAGLALLAIPLLRRRKRR